MSLVSHLECVRIVRLSFPAVFILGQDQNQTIATSFPQRQSTRNVGNNIKDIYNVTCQQLGCLLDIGLPLPGLQLVVAKICYTCFCLLFISAWYHFQLVEYGSLVSGLELQTMTLCLLLQHQFYQ